MLIRKDLMTKHNIDIKTRQQIDELYQSGETLKNISIITHYSFPVLTRILKEDGLYSPKYKRWTDSEINFLRSEYGEASWDTLLQHLSRWTKSDIIQKASDLHLKRNIYFWTDHDIQILKNNYHTQGDVHIVYMLLQKNFQFLQFIVKHLNCNYPQEIFGQMKKIYYCNSRMESQHLTIYVNCCRHDLVKQLSLMLCN